MTTGDSKDRSLGKNVSFSEKQRKLLITIIQVTYKNILLPSEEAHDILKSIRLAVDFSPAEQEIMNKRPEKITSVMKPVPKGSPQKP